MLGRTTPAPSPPHTRGPMALLCCSLRLPFACLMEGHGVQLAARAMHPSPMALCLHAPCWVPGLSSWPRTAARPIQVRGGLPEEVPEG